MNKRDLIQSVVPLVGWLAGGTHAMADSSEADLALVLAIDVSYSVDSFEHDLQIRGTAEALQSEEVLKAIQAGKHQRIAVTAFQWSDANEQQVIVPWTIIANEADAKSFAAGLVNAERSTREGGTAMSAALLFASKLMNTAPVSSRQVIDIATDGRNNVGHPVYVARDDVVSQGITINGLAVSNEWKQLPTYLERQVIGGNGAFVEEAKSYDDFGAAMLRKLLREIIGPTVT